MSAVLSVTKVTTYAQRRAITLEADAKQDGVLENAKRDGYSINWNRVLSEVHGDGSPLRAIRSALIEDLGSSDFYDTIRTLNISGELIAAHAVRRHERLAGIRNDALPVIFAEPEAFTPTQAITRWKKILNITDEEADRLLSRSYQKEALNIRDRVAAAAMESVSDLYEDAIAEGLSTKEFLDRAREIFPDKTDAMLTAEFRTTLADTYTGALEEQIIERAASFPFIQFMAVKDSRTTWWICLPMGTAGPNRTGFIAATNDLIWTIWRPPVHYSCRSALSPISYLEAQRLGILSKDGRTKIAIVGGNPNRPFGDPPDFAENPFDEEGQGGLRKVEPQEGFGGGTVGPESDADVQPTRAPKAKSERSTATRTTATKTKRKPSSPEPSLDTLSDRLKNAPKSIDGEKLLDRKRITKDWEYKRDSGVRPVPPPAAWVVSIVLAAIDAVSAQATNERDRVDVPIPLVRQRLAGELPGGAFDQALLGMHYNGDGIYLLPASSSETFDFGFVMSKTGTVYSRVRRN